MSQAIKNKIFAKNERIGSASVHAHRFSCAKTAKKIRCQSLRASKTCRSPHITDVLLC